MFAWRYGYVPPGQERSITELEYRTAVKHGKDRLIFLLREDAPWPPSQVDKGADAARVQALREELRREHLCSFFSTPDELARLVTTAVVRQLTKEPEDKPSYVYEGATVVHLAYRHEIAQLLAFYTQVFVGREREFDRLTALATTEKPGYALIEAPAGYGKSALLAQLVQRHETGRWGGPGAPALVYFFVREEGSRHTPGALCLAVNSQLLDLLGLPGGVPAELEAQRSQLLGLWAAASAAASAARPLLLLVDGLDEMDSGPVTIADLLPAELGPYVHVLVASRPDPEPLAQVPPEHPLRRAEVIRLHTLDAAEVTALLVAQGSPAELGQMLAARVVAVTGGEPLLARFVAGDVALGGQRVLEGLERDPPAGVKDYFKRQFRQLDARAAGDTAWEALGVLLVARAAMAVEELAGVLEVPKRQVTKAIEPIRRFLLGPDRLELMHLELRAVVAEQFSPAERQNYRRRLLAWCGRAAVGDRPEDIPDYVLSHYAAHLRAAGDHEALYGLIAREWMELKLARTHSHQSFAQDLLLAIESANSEAPSNLLQEVRGSIVYATLTSMATSVPIEVLRVLAEVGQLSRAEGYASLIADIEQRSRAYGEIGLALLRRGPTDEVKRVTQHALTAAQAIEEASAKAQALAVVAGTLIQTGQPEQAISAATMAVSLAVGSEASPWKIEVLASSSEAFARTGQTEWALTAIRDVKDPSLKAPMLAAIAEALTQAGEADQAGAVADMALTTTHTIRDPKEQARVLVAVAARLISNGRAEAVLAVAHTIADPSGKAKTLAAVAQALAQVGQIDQARAVAQQSVVVAQTIAGVMGKARVLAAVAGALGRLDR